MSVSALFTSHLATESVESKIMPCFPTQKNKVVEPEQIVPPTKNVNRYGETSIKHVNRPLKPEQWKKGFRDPNYGRRLPHVPAEIPPSYRAPPPPRPQTPPTPTELRPPKHKQQPLRADFFISVPIFTETFDHSYRKKNEYVFTDNKEDETSLYHQSLSRASSLRDLSLKGTYRSMESQQVAHTAPTPLKPKRRPRSENRSDLNHSGSLNSSLDRGYSDKHHSRVGHKKRLRRPQSGSEASFKTYSSRGSYEDERLDKAISMKKAPKKRGILIDSEDEDER